MINIHCNITGTPDDTPVIIVDTGITRFGDLSTPGRCTFPLPDDTPPHGAYIHWNGKSARTVIAIAPNVPLTPGDYEGGSLYEPIPTLVYDAFSLTALTTLNDHFITADEGMRWWWRGATDMLLPARLEVGEDIRPLLEQRANAGANIVRSLAMGYPFWPSGAPVREETARAFFTLAAEYALYVEWVVFAGTRDNMPELAKQQAFWLQNIRMVRDYSNVLVELLNEAGHGSQRIDPAQFGDPIGVLASHGSGLTDAPPVTPLWDFATYHPRRDRPPDARGFTNYDAYEFQAEWPKPCPFIPDEGIKPHEYGFDTRWAYQMGLHAAACAGGTFHSDAGVRSLLWTPQEVRCAEAFYSGIG